MLIITLRILKISRRRQREKRKFVTGILDAVMHEVGNEVRGEGGRPDVAIDMKCF